MNKSVHLSNLPSTSAAAHTHISNVFIIKYRLGLGHDFEPENWDLIMRHEFLVPVMPMNLPAPKELFNTKFCKNGCGS